jgi:hypothetical protein
VSPILVPFYEGGWPMYGVLACTLLAHPVALAALIVAFASRRRGMVLGLSAAALLLGLSTACTGAAGYAFGLHQMNEALAGAWLEPAQVEALRAAGESEAGWNLVCGMAGAALPVLLALVGLARGLTLRESAPTGPRG